MTKKLGLGISYQDVKNLYATWALQDKKSGCCPREIASGYPATAVMDNNDFKDDTLTGADTSHRINVMFVQREELQTLCHSERPVLATHNDLKVVADESNKVRPYRTIRKGVPPIRKEFDTSPSTKVSIRKEEMMHTFARIGHKISIALTLLKRKLDHLVDFNQLFKIHLEEVRRTTCSHCLRHSINLWCKRSCCV